MNLTLNLLRTLSYQSTLIVTEPVQPVQMFTLTPDPAPADDAFQRMMKL